LWAPLPCLPSTKPKSTGSTRFVAPPSVTPRTIRDTPSTIVRGTRCPSLRLIEALTDNDGFAISYLGHDVSVIFPVHVDRSFNVCRRG